MVEKEYKEALERAVRLAHEGRNYISEEEYQKIFSPLNMSKEQDELTRKYFEGLNISFGERKDEDERDMPLEKEDGNYLSFYLESLEGLKEYSDDEKKKIFDSAISGDIDEVREDLINMHLKDVVDIAKLYVYHGMSLEDLIGEGNIGLMMAVDILGTVDSMEEAEGLIGKTVMDSMDAAIKRDRELKDEMDLILERINNITALAKELSEEVMRDLSLQEIVDNSDYTLEEVTEAWKFTGGTIPGVNKEEQ